MYELHSMKSTAAGGHLDNMWDSPNNINVLILDYLFYDITNGSGSCRSLSLGEDIRSFKGCISAIPEQLLTLQNRI